jgi:hypothetical protein
MRFYPLPEIDFQRQLPLGEIWESTKTTRRQLAFYENTARQGEIEETLRQLVYNLLDKRLPELPANGEGEEASIGVPLYSLHRAPAEDINALIHILNQKPEEDSPFVRVGDTLFRNILLVSGLDPEKNHTSQQLVMPLALKDKKTPGELVRLYLHDTPFEDFFMTPLPFTIPLKSRFSHTHIVGGSGHGKTQLMQNFILSDLPLVGEGKASVIVIDSQGGFVPKRPAPSSSRGARGPGYLHRSQ